MKININPTVLFRVPKFSYQDEIQNNWEELKAAIAVSSAQFYETIKNTSAEEFDVLPLKVKFTLWKYFNRAKFRATPYGSFAGYGLFKLNEPGHAAPIVVANEQIIKAFIDWPQKSLVSISVDELIKKDCYIISNNTQYLVSEKLRYIAKSDDGFELCDHNPDPLEVLILSICQMRIRINALIQKLATLNIGYSVVLEKIDALLDLQLLLTELHPNIIGEDYFQRLNIELTPDSPQYLIAQRPFAEGTLPPGALQHLPGMFNILQRLAPANKTEGLEGFIQRFIQKFEQREIPLMIALDPEIGVGYGNLESITTADVFVQQFTGRDSNNKTANNFKEFLKNALLGTGSTTKPTLLLSDSLLPEDSESDPIPNSLSMILTIANELICVESVGGCTANALLGRFTLGDVDLTRHCNAIANAEQEANPDVVFFDLAYMDESHVDNINRREKIYSTQLSILDYDTTEHPITLSDLMVSVKGNKVILRSKMLNKRLIPRMCSAYNYTRSDLSVFRLLCDLQYQGIQTFPIFKLENIFPKLKYYPRVQYKNILLSTSKWRIKEVIKFFDKKPTVEKCRYFLQSRQVTRYFKAGIADQTLCFDLYNDQDMEMLIRVILKEPDLLLTEVAVPNHTAVTDVLGKPYLAEFIVTISHDETIYKGMPTGEELPAIATQSIYPPGTSWLYYEIYCHPIRANSILEEYVLPFLDNHQSDIEQWFFIRYNENGEHLRLRIKMNDESKGHILTSDLTKRLSGDVQTGIVSDIQIKTYKREVERYHPEHIDAVELHFHHDSNFILALLKNLPEELKCYQLCHKIFEAVRKAGLFDQTEFMNSVMTNSDYFNEEHKLKVEDFKSLNERYRQYLQADSVILSPEQERLFFLFLDSFIEVLQDCKQERRMQLFRDILHMHVNRLFSDHQRTHEMIIYYFVLKDIKRKIALQSFVDSNC
ncbi:lantibiotic dehydratase [Pedobacter sp. B4-66]|uniref:lantibiotic dehydratase n=1 Tax=Pedobacter sp. B4-66 TaxID=2817280 RepID=UPI001BDB506B|nr:lantibiotic dehydratase [Pedobacter sp. B4-66]